MRKDDIGLNEAYNQIINNNQVLEEGIWDTVKAKAAGGWAGFQPKAMIKSGIASGLGKVAGLVDKQSGQRLQKVGADARQQMRDAGMEAKVNSILNSHLKSINNVSSEIIKDLNRLNLNPDGITPDQLAKQMLNKFENILIAQTPSLQGNTSGGNSTPATQSKPQTPKPNMGETVDLGGKKYIWAGNGWALPSKTDPSKPGQYISTKNPQGKTLSDKLMAAWNKP